MSERVAFGSQLQAELGLLTPRLKAFAVSLTGNAGEARGLLKSTVRLVALTAARERGHTPLATFAYTRMHTLWVRHEQGRSAAGHPAPAADAQLFANRGCDAVLAQAIAQMPAQQRATVSLIYGDGVSYDEAAEIFGVSVAVVMARLVRSHAAIAGFDADDDDTANPSFHEYSQDLRESAA